MSDDRIERRYCAVVQLKDGRQEMLRESVPLIVETIKEWGHGDVVQLSRSSDGTLFSFLFKSKKPAGMLSAEFESCKGTRHGDTFIAFEIGDECSSSDGFQRPLAWIQHR
jgi:hypothetical protein